MRSLAILPPPPPPHNHHPTRHNHTQVTATGGRVPAGVPGTRPALFWATALWDRNTSYWTPATAKVSHLGGAAAVPVSLAHQLQPHGLWDPWLAHSWPFTSTSNDSSTRCRCARDLLCRLPTHPITTHPCATRQAWAAAIRKAAGSAGAKLAISAYVLEDPGWARSP